MPAISGQIEYSDYTVFMTMSMMDMFPQTMAQFPERCVGFTIDPRFDAYENVLGLIHHNLPPFFDGLAKVNNGLPVNTVGVMVWQGNLLVDHNGEVTFDGTFRRPTPEDWAAWSDIHVFIDSETEKDTLEHAKTCLECALRLGLDPSEVTEPEEGHEHQEHPWFSGPMGEA